MATINPIQGRSRLLEEVRELGIVEDGDEKDIRTS
jgi:hypothetical protein